MKNKILLIVVVSLMLYIFFPLVKIGFFGLTTTLYDIKLQLSSRESIEQKMDNATKINKKIRFIIAFADTGINDDYVINKLEDMLYHTIPNSSFSASAKEIISIGLVMRLSESNRDDRFLKLVKIASNNSFSFDTRSTALDELYFDLPPNTTIDKSDIKARLQQLSKDILSSPNDFKNEAYQKMLYEDVLKIIQILEKK
ncbi:MAG: hypothetical protein U9N49_12050 [Campylobacterota bacterium]|nr:hypothetical protein [Campylobacterota bacterium]